MILVASIVVVNQFVPVMVIAVLQFVLVDNFSIVFFMRVFFSSLLLGLDNTVVKTSLFRFSRELILANVCGLSAQY